MSQPIRVLHYLNQFFGGIGGEDKSNTPVQVQSGPVGPGRALQQALGDRGTLVASVIGGDDYVAENEDEAGASIDQALDAHTPDLVLAGPAFDSGRYGLGCALTCRRAQARGIPAVTAMHPDNAAIITHRRELLAVPTGSDPSEMQAILVKLAELGLKLASGAELGPAAEEGYIPRGIRRLVFKDKVGYERALEMLLARVEGRPFASEVQVQQYETVPPTAPIEDLSQATVAFVVSTGMVPRGNPDRIPGGRSLEAHRYSIEGLDELALEDWESAHGGLNTTILNTQNPNYGMPLPSLRGFEAAGTIKAVHPFFYSLVGNQTAVSVAQEIGRTVAHQLKEEGVDGVLQVSG